MESALATRLYQPLSRLHADYSNILIDLTTGTSRALYEMLMDNQLDAIFIADAPEDGRADSMSVFEEQLCLIAHRDHAAIKSPADIAGDALLVFNEGCAYRTRLLDWFETGGASHGRIVALASCHAIMGCAASGMGIGLIPSSLLENSPQKDSLSVHTLSRPFDTVATRLVWRKGMTSANLAALKQCLPIERKIEL